MNRNSLPFLVKPKPCRPSCIQSVHSAPCIHQVEDPHTDSDDCRLDELLERRMQSMIQARVELSESRSSNSCLLFRPPSTRPTNPFVCGLVSD